MIQNIRVACDVILYEDADINLTFIKLNEAIGNDKQFKGWLEADIDDENDCITLYGETENLCDYVPGEPGDRWTPPMRAYAEGSITTDELKDMVKDLIKAAHLGDDVAEIEHNDTEAETENDMFEREFYDEIFY